MSAALHHRHRGLTLLEVLVASAILAMLAGACVRVIARAMVLLQDRRESTIALLDLAAVADAFMVKAETTDAAGGETPLQDITRLQIAWPTPGAEDGTGPSASFDPIIVQALRQEPSAADHVWLAFECQGVRVYRWVPISEEVVSTEDGHSKEGSP